MKRNRTATAGVAVFLTFIGSAALGQERRQDNTRFDDHARQTTTDWYNQHKDHPPAGFRDRDRLSPDQESRVREGAVLDPELRRQVHNPPADLRRRLPPPPPGHRYVTFGFHVGLIDRGYNVKDVIHVHDR
jgi:hypothetical protein